MRWISYIRRSLRTIRRSASLSALRYAILRMVEGGAYETSI